MKKKKLDLNKIFPKKINLGKRNWGSENLLVLIPKVLSLKKIKIKKGKKGGLQFHRLKNECGYLLKGKLHIFTKKNNKIIKKTLMKVGDLVETSKNESHAIKALVNSEFLVFTQGPRGGKEYENDTFRLKKPLIK